MDGEVHRLMGEIKPSFDENRQVLGEVLPLDTPFNVILDISEACNFKCNYCFRSDEDKTHWGYAKNKQTMEWDIFLEAVRQIKEFPQEVKQISLSNHGEPLVNRKLPNMVRHIKEQGIKSRVSIHTNGSLLDKEYIKNLADSNIDRVVISLQGLSSQKYYDICGVKIDYKKFYENICFFYEVKKNTQIQIKIADAALEEGEQQKFYEMYQPISDRCFIEKIVPIWKDVKIEGVSEWSKNKYGDSFEQQECCSLVFHTIVIIPNGDVYPCTQLQMPMKLGNITQNSLLALWNGNERKKILVNQCKLLSLDICKKCHIRQNSIFSQEDMIDAYRIDIMRRIEGKTHSSKLSII